MNSLVSALDFTAFLALAAFPLAFYGRLLLRLLGIRGKRLRWGDPAGLCAGLAALATLGLWCVFVQEEGARGPFRAFLGLGLLGTLGEGIFAALRSRKARLGCAPGASAGGEGGGGDAGRSGSLGRSLSPGSPGSPG
ncbi:MAG: hypothetical protein LBQ12_08760, partial [Deltaproteobacteria bacterium]|nr:hypothetical protein [Deltaproteobacteria bacterium]